MDRMGLDVLRGAIAFRGEADVFGTTHRPLDDPVPPWPNGNLPTTWWRCCGISINAWNARYSIIMAPWTSFWATV